MKRPWQNWLLMLLCVTIVVPAMWWMTLKALEIDGAQREAQRQTEEARRMEAEAPVVKVTFKPGQKVRIIDGPFNDIVGIVDEIDMERAKVRVMVSFFGRETPVELDFLQVEKT